ncbi:MAG: alpha/beta hydrolase [Lachnospiraceae bacterium]
MKENEVSTQGRVMRDLIARFSSDNKIGRKLKSGELRKNMVEPQWKCPEHLSLTVIPMENFNMELLEGEQPHCEQIILQLHGGGYIGAMRNAYRSFAGLYNELGKGISVLSVDYRVAPENPYPAALLDAIASYDWLIEKGYQEENIIVAGDSAGGGLALGLCMWLKDNHRKLPGGIILMSPWTDLTASGASYDDNYELDPLFGRTRDSLLYNKDYVGEQDPRLPYISPLFGSYQGFPPMLIQVGSYEMLLSDSVQVAQKAREQGVKVRLSVYEGMFHIFQMAMLYMPESKKAWIEVGKFLQFFQNKKEK